MGIIARLVDPLLALWPLSISSKCSEYLNILYTHRIRKEFASFGKDSILERHLRLYGVHNVRVGSACVVRRYSNISTWDTFNGLTYHPKITIGDHTQIGEFCNISAINSIDIGRNVLMGRWITIIDHSHGYIKDMDVRNPMRRVLFSKGPIVIGDNVWIGDKVTIMPNVKIGDCAIIGANSVITHDIPSGAVVGGVNEIIRNINYE